MAQSKGKEKIHHPSSRKAGQLATAALRKARLHNLSSKRFQKQHSLLDTYQFFFSALPDEGVLSLSDLHHVVKDIWLTRFDEQLLQERSARRKGRPKSIKETKLEEITLREGEEYRTGLEVVDLTHPVNVQLFRDWNQEEVAYVEQLRFIRINGTSPNIAVVSRRGKHTMLKDTADQDKDADMAVVGN